MMHESGMVQIVGNGTIPRFDVLVNQLYIPTEFAAGVFDALMAEGEALGLRLVGLHALDSLRLEKGYRHWGSDITPNDTPMEAGLGFCVNLDKGDFIGKVLHAG